MKLLEVLNIRKSSSGECYWKIPFYLSGIELKRNIENLKT